MSILCNVHFVLQRLRNAILLTKRSNAGCKASSLPRRKAHGVSCGRDRDSVLRRNSCAPRCLREHREFPRPWRRDPFDRDGAVDTLMQTLAEVGALGRGSSWPVDFKTDWEFEKTADRYIAQGRIYAKAVGAATNSPARGVLLVV